MQGLKRAIFFAIFLSTAPTLSLADCVDQYFKGRTPVITNPTMRQQSTELCYSHFAVMHSGITRTPLWSAERLTRQQVEAAKGMKRDNAFHPEYRLPVDQRSELRDFVRSGYDRGHLSPSGDEPDAQSQYESFTLANIIPQDPDNNRNLHEGIEAAVRTLALQNGELYIITGPLFQGKQLSQLNGRVMVPTQIYKAIYDPSRNRAAAYLEDNAPGMDYQIVSVADLEKMAGINLFPFLPDSIKRAKMDLPIPTPHGHGRGDASHSRGSEKAVSHALRTLFH